ncbi:Kelch-like protein 32 [Camelus dromedarius]|uniref:Kelch-like protein 32 n=1 Tax=Camelus dromedarius TaxID=9838 RepID=A0A5N4DXD9_CAMDR|nr:Kelch-like protein 32 [Camelus dromedarius]
MISHCIQEMLTGQRLCHSESHNDSVLAALNQQRSDGILCDVTLIAEEQKFHAHKAVLAACSDYFRKRKMNGIAITITFTITIIIISKIKEDAEKFTVLKEIGLSSVRKEASI